MDAIIALMAKRATEDEILRHILHGEIYVEDFSELKELFEAFNSCKRFSYSRLAKDGISDPRSTTTSKYENSLNSRWRSDATMKAKGIYNRIKRDKDKQDFKVIFGGRKAWEDYKKGKLSRDEWLLLRSKHIYSRGDKSKKGNPNLRITEKGLRVSLGIQGKSEFKYYPFHFSSRQRPRTANATRESYISDQEQLRALVASGQAYNVQLSRKPEDPKHLQVTIDFQTELQKPSYGFDNGILGIDTNPDRMALAFVDSEGNLVKTQTLINSRLLYGSSHKRLYDLGILVKQIICIAKENRLAVAFEDLEFKKDLSAYPKKLRRMFSNFVWKKFLEILERACKKNRIPYKKVHPAYTSFIGRLKYQEMHRITVHEAAAYTIGRRGLGYNETPSIFGISKKLIKQWILRTLEGKYRGKRIHNWSLWRVLKKHEKTVLTELQDCKLFGLKESDGYLCGKSCDVGEIPTGKSSAITGRRGKDSLAVLAGDERRPKSSSISVGF